uniref:Transposase n=1 Tax=Globodera pallida TaxID=36090 RepID=A0A183CH56_GLOPA
MYVKKVSLMDGLALDIARKLELKPARYAVRKTMMKSMFISQGRSRISGRNPTPLLCRCRMPVHIINVVVFVIVVAAFSDGRQ